METFLYFYCFLVFINRIISGAVLRQFVKGYFQGNHIEDHKISSSFPPFFSHLTIWLSPNCMTQSVCCSVDFYDFHLLCTGKSGKLWIFMISTFCVYREKWKTVYISYILHIECFCGACCFWVSFSTKLVSY